MPHDNLPEFLARLQDDGELRRVAVEVDPYLEVTEIVDRICKRPNGGPALFFEHLRGSPLPLVVNLFGNQRRICSALELKTFDELEARLNSAMHPEVQDGWFQKLKFVSSTASMTPWKPVTLKTGIAQQVVKLGRDIDLRELPALQVWPDDSGRVLHGGMVFSENPLTRERYLETIPFRIVDRSVLEVHWTPFHSLFQAFQAHRSRGTNLSLAIVFGGDPAWQLATNLPRPTEIDPFEFGGCLRGKPLEIIRARQVELEVPANAEIVMEGYIDTQRPLALGIGFGQSPGFYGAQAEVATLTITTVTHRGNPILVQSVPGRPPMEESAIMELKARLCLPMLRRVAPEIIDFRFVQNSTNDLLAMVSFDKTYPMQARKVMNAIWGSQATMFTKMVIAVDGDVPLSHPGEVLRAAVHHLHPHRDLVLSDGPAHPADHASPVWGMGSRVGLDATRKLVAEGHPRLWPGAVQMTDAIQQLVDQRWKDYLIDR